MKKILAIAGVLVLVLVLVAVALPFFIDANRFKPTLEADLSSALGRDVQIGNISLSLWSGSVAVDQISIADDPAFGKNPFLTAASLKAGVAMMPLIFHKQLQVLSFSIDQPQVALIRNAAGKWNFSSLGAKSVKPTSTDNSAPTDITVQKLTLSNGKMTVSEANGKTRAYDGVNVTAENVSYTSEFPFEFSANTPGQGTIKLSGQAGPVNRTDAAATPLHATIGVSHFDLASTGFVDPSSGLGGLVDFNGQLDSDGKEIDSHGAITATSLKLVAGASPSTVPVNVDYETTYDPKKEAGVLKRGNVHVGKAAADLTGSYDLAGQAPTVALKLNGRGMSVPDLEGVLPAVAVKLPSGATLQSGAMETALAINGPVDKLVITGPVTLSDAKMTGFSLGGALGALSSFAGLGNTGGSDTEIQTFHADVRVDPAGQHAQNINLVVPAIGTVTGAGDATAAGDLNCKMVAAVSGAGGMLTSVMGGGKSGGKSQGIPFTIKGTTSHPIFVPDVSGLAKGFLNNAAGGAGSGSATDAAGAAASALGGLFHKKKSQ